MPLFCDASQQVRFPYSDSRLGYVQSPKALFSVPSHYVRQCRRRLTHVVMHGKSFCPLYGLHVAGVAGRLTRHYHTHNDLYASEPKAVPDSTSDFVRTFLGTRTRVFGAVLEATNVTYRYSRYRRRAARSYGIRPASSAQHKHFQSLPQCTYSATFLLLERVLYLDCSILKKTFPVQNL